MGRRKGEAKRIKPGSKPRKLTLYTEDAPNDAKARATDVAGGQLSAKNGELPLFFPNSPKLVRSHQVGRRISRQIETSSPKLEKAKDGAAAQDGAAQGGAGHGRSGVSADVHLGAHVDSGWPLQHQEIATWASSFHFELDALSSTTLQAMLEREAAQSSGTPGGSFRSTPNGSFRSTPGGSFRFRNGTEEMDRTHLPHGSHLKPSRQMETPAIHGSNRFEANDISSEKLQGGDANADTVPENSGIVSLEDCNNVAVDVPNSPERSVILQRLRDLKTHSLASPRFGLEDDASYHKELAKLAVGRDDGLNQWLKTSSPLWKASSKSNISTPHIVNQLKEITTTPGELEIMPKQSNSISKLRESPRRTAAQEFPSITPTSSRLRNGGSSRSGCLQEQILTVSKQTLTRNVNSPSPDHTHFLPAAIPFQWEDQPGKPKSVRLSRRLSREATTEIIKHKENLEETGGTSAAGDGGIGIGIGDGDRGRTESHRYYGMRGHSREPSLGQSTRYSTSEKFEAQIDLDASAAAKFLVEQYDTPLSTPGRHSSSVTFAVPFKWEDAPGKAKAEAPARRPNLLQLPPRLAVPSFRSGESFSRDLRASHPFGGFFAPCMMASSPGQRDRKLVQLASSRSLPPRAPSPPERRKRHGLVGRCSSLPQEGCHITVSRSAASSPVLKPSGRNLCSNPNAPSSPTSILYGPDGSSSQTSASNLMFSSGDLDDFTQQTSKSSSYESIEADFAELASASSHSLPPLHSVGTLKPKPHRSRSLGAPTASTSRNCDPATSTSPSLGARTASASRNCDPATSTLLGAPSASASRSCHPATLTSPSLGASTAGASRNCDPATSTSPLLGARTTSASRNCDPATSTSTSLGAPTASASRNFSFRVSTSTLLGAPTALASRNCHPATSTSPLLGAPTTSASRSCDLDIRSVQLQGEVLKEAQASPKRPTRLPYTMPSVAEQVLASCGETARRQLIQDLSPRLLRQYSGQRLTRSSNTPASRSAAASEDASSPSPAYAAALELLSPAMAQRRKARSPARAPLVAKSRRRPRFMLSICRTLKRVLLGKQRRRKPIEPKLMMYCDALAPTTFQFSKPN